MSSLADADGVGQAYIQIRGIIHMIRHGAYRVLSRGKKR